MCGIFKAVISQKVKGGFRGERCEVAVVVMTMTLCTLELATNVFQTRGGTQVKRGIGDVPRNRVPFSPLW